MKRHKAGADLSNDIRSVLTIWMCWNDSKPSVCWQRRKSAVRWVRGTVETFLTLILGSEGIPILRLCISGGVPHRGPILATFGLCVEFLQDGMGGLLLLLVAAVSIPAAIITGYVTWWGKLELHDSHIIARKRQLAWVALAIAGFAVVLRSFVLADPLDFRSASSVDLCSHFVGARGTRGRSGYVSLWGQNWFFLTTVINCELLFRN